MAEVRQSLAEVHRNQADVKESLAKVMLSMEEVQRSLSNGAKSSHAANNPKIINETQNIGLQPVRRAPDIKAPAIDNFLIRTEERKPSLVAGPSISKGLNNTAWEPSKPSVSSPETTSLAANDEPVREIEETGQSFTDPLKTLSAAGDGNPVRTAEETIGPLSERMEVLSDARSNNSVDIIEQRSYHRPDCTETLSIEGTNGLPPRDGKPEILQSPSPSSESELSDGAQMASDSPSPKQSENGGREVVDGIENGERFFDGEF